MLDQNPHWARRDAVHAIQSRQRLNLAAVTRFLGTHRWDLPDLVAACQAPVLLIAGTPPGTAVSEPDLRAVEELLPTERIRIVDSGHSIHLDRPGLWLQAVVDFARGLPPSPGR